MPIKYLQYINIIVTEILQDLNNLQKELKRLNNASDKLEKRLSSPTTVSPGFQQYDNYIENNINSSHESDKQWHCNLIMIVLALTSFLTYFM